MDRQIAALDGQILRSKEKSSGLYDDLAKQFDQFGKLQDDSKDIDLTTLKGVMTRNWPCWRPTSKTRTY